MGVENRMVGVSRKSGQYTSRSGKTTRVKPCPKELVRFITLANLTSLGADLPDFEGRVVQTARAAIETNQSVVNEWLQQLPAGFRGRLKRRIAKEQTDPEEALWLIARETAEASEVQKTFRQIVAFSQKWIEADHVMQALKEKVQRAANRPDAAAWEQERATNWNPHMPKPYFKVQARAFDDEGFVHAAYFGVWRSIIGRKTEDLTRIRECENCRRIFWAGRIGLQGCRPRCLDILRKRRKRKRDAAPRKPPKEHVESVRAALRDWQGDIQQLAERADLTLEQCKAAYLFIKETGRNSA